MYEFCYDYVKPKYGQKTILSYMGTNSYIVYIKTNYISKYIAENLETRLYPSN